VEVDVITTEFEFENHHHHQNKVLEPTNLDDWWSFIKESMGGNLDCVEEHA
jgi:hypothetical protein